MFVLNNLSAPIGHTQTQLHDLAAGAIDVSPCDIVSLSISKKAIDARKKGSVHFVYTLHLELAPGCAPNSLATAYTPALHVPQPAIFRPTKPPVIAGFGPAGMFAALTLIDKGICPIILERGQSVTDRQKAIQTFWTHGQLEPNSNIQFGEGGAGTFSDGKLTTGIKSPLIRHVLQTFVRFGAPDDILINAKPHIGTDYLINVVKNLRLHLIEHGAQIRFCHTLQDITIDNNELQSITVDGPDGSYTLETDNLILATGHSARDTYQMLQKRGASLLAKDFSVGVRIEHKQSDISRLQYGKFTSMLGAADYKLACKLPNGRGVYTFCMCPGGMVVAAASEENTVVTNGMSYFARDMENANSALLVSVIKDDFPGDDPLRGMYFQRQLEQRAFVLGGSNYKAPATLVGDFLQGRSSSHLGNVTPSYPMGVTLTDIAPLFPDFVTNALKQGITMLDKKLRGFAHPGAVLTGPESRSSAPVRIVRDQSGMSNIHGLFPCGEGSGYAGGIVSAAIDGIKIAERFG